MNMVKKSETKFVKIDVDVIEYVFSKQECPKCFSALRRKTTTDMSEFSDYCLSCHICNDVYLVKLIDESVLPTETVGE